MSNITFAHPWILLGLIMVPLMAAWYVWRYRKQDAALQHSNIALFAGVQKTLRQRLRWLPYALRVVAVGAMVVAPLQDGSGGGSRREGKGRCQGELGVCGNGRPGRVENQGPGVSADGGYGIAHAHGTGRTTIYILREQQGVLPVLGSGRYYGRYHQNDGI